MSTPSSDLAVIVAQSQERLGSLSDKIGALHTRQDKMENEIKALLKEVSAEMKDLKKEVHTEFKLINEYINKSKGKMAVIAAIATIVGGLIGKFLIK